MEQLIDGFDWASTPIGARESWPQSLRTSLSICLASRFPILIWWGPELTMLYNDAYAAILGGKHPRSLGAPGREVWGEIWDVIGPMLDQVRFEGKATWSDDQYLMVDRHGFAEETYFTFSYSPITDESGGIGGIFTAVFETTSRVVGERRVETLRRLAARTGEAKTVDEACFIAADTLAANPHDVPFATLYLRTADEKARLVSSVGPPPWQPPEVLDWTVTPDLWNGVALPLPLSIPGEPEAIGLLLAGVSPCRPLDDDYRTFFSLAAGHIASAAADARAYEYQRQRAEALAELDRAKTEFFSNVSHEFRTPLTLMLGPLEDVLAGGGLGDDDRERLGVMQRNALRLLKLVNTLLDFSRIEAGRIDATYEATDLASLTAEFAGVFRSAVERAGLRLHVDCPPLGEPVFVDREMWEKIVLNLLSNAFKFTFEGEISVKLRKRDGRAELTVRDTGTGIPGPELPRVFDRFHRVRGAQARTHEGSGIGLALVRELTRLHGGEVRAESEPGRGSTFTISIPFSSAHLPSDRIGAPRLLESTAIGSDVWTGEALRWISSPAPPAAPSTRDAGRPRVLVVDDNADLRHYLARLLSADYEVETATDGASALEQARRRVPDLVISDVMMPRLDGFGLLRELRRDDRMRDVAVILLSARAGEGSQVEGMEADADDYLVKPFSARELLARAGAHVRLQRARREAHDAVLESETRFRRFADAAPAILWITEPDGTCSFVSRGWYDFTGQTEEKALGTGWLDAIHPGDRPAAEEAFRAANARHETFEIDYRIRCADGGYRWAIDSGRPRFGPDGEFLGMIGSVIDITERKHAEQAKDEFLATLSHELRTPLTSGFGWVKLIGRTADPDLLAAGLDAIQESFVNQMKLIDDLLDVSRIAAGKLHLDLQTQDVGSIVESAVATLGPAAAAKGIDIRLRIESILSVRGDASRLRQVFWNLLSNAVKFTPRGGVVEVDVRERDGHVEVVVGDDGEGIDPKFLPHVFDRFRQADASTTRRHGGLGIGLAIVSSLVERHGGSVRAESEGQGTGAKFTVSLPLVAQAPLSVVAKAGTKATSLAGTRILVVDDDAGARRFMIATLQEAGAEVRECGNARDAFTAAAEWRPDILISDLAMPNEDGYSLLRRLRDNGHAMPALATTACVRPEDEARVREAGFRRHVAKPFDPEELIRAVDEAGRPAP